MPNLLKTVANSALSVVGVRTEEQPAYQVVERIGDVEVRRYALRFAAETTVTAADDNKARSEAFNILAGYIFGKNRNRREIAMTAPVATEGGREIAMTAPVQTSSSDNHMTMRFFLPSDVTPSNAPVPDDPRVRLVEIPQEHLAVLQFTGTWSGDALRNKQHELLTALKDSTWETVGEPFSQLYDPPWTIPFLRRNEAAVRVRKRN